MEKHNLDDNSIITVANIYIVRWQIKNELQQCVSMIKKRVDLRNVQSILHEIKMQTKNFTTHRRSCGCSEDKIWISPKYGKTHAPK